MIDVSWTNFVLAIATLLVFMVTKGISKWGMPWLNLGLAVVAGIFLARSTPVVWALDLLAGFLNWVGGLVGLDGTLGGAAVVAGIAVLVLAVRLVVDVIFNKKADGKTFNDAIAISLVAVIAAGPVAQVVTGVGDAVQANGGGGISRAIGG